MQKFVRWVLLGIIMLGAAACDQLMPELGAVVTPEATPEIRNVSLSGEYFLTITDASEHFPETTPDAPEGFKWIVVTASINNTTGPTIKVEEGSLYLVNDKGERYVVETPDEAAMPSLVGAVILAEQGIRGLARFAIPEDSKPVRLEWCIDATCEEKLAIDVPQS